MKHGTTKALRVGCILLVLFFSFCAFAFLPQPVRAQNTVLTTIASTSLSAPSQIAISPNGTYGYVTNVGNLSPISATGGTSVTEINVTKNTVMAVITTGDDPVDVAFTPNGAYVYVTNHGGVIVPGSASIAGSISVINTATNAVNNILVGSVSPTGVAITPNGAYAYVTNDVSGTVSVISTATNTVTATITLPLDAYSSAVAITPNGAYAYVTNGGLGTVSVISTATNTVTATITVGTSPTFVAVTPNGAYAYVTNGGSSTVSVISTTSNTVTATVNTGVDPIAEAITPNSAYVYVGNHNPLASTTGFGGGGTVSVIATATNTVTATITIGNSPFGVAITPNGAYTYVANQVDNTISVINSATSTVPTVSVLPSSWIMDVGQSETFTTAASGGTGTYTSYQWYVNGAAQSGQTASTFNYSPAATGTYSITATVTDSSGATSAQSTAATVTVQAAGVPTPTPVPTSTPPPVVTPTPVPTLAPQSTGGLTTALNTPVPTNPPTATPTTAPTVAPTPTPTPTPTINEFSTASAIIIAAILVTVAFGTYAYTRRTKK